MGLRFLVAPRSFSSIAEVENIWSQQLMEVPLLAVAGLEPA